MNVITGPWAEHAACKGKTHLFFVDESHGPATSFKAKAICAGCDVRADCLAHALEHYERGIWGGTTWTERGRIRNGTSATPRLGVPYADRTCVACQGRFHAPKTQQRCDDCRAVHRAVLNRIAAARRKAAS